MLVLCKSVCTKVNFALKHYNCTMSINLFVFKNLFFILKRVWITRLLTWKTWHWQIWKRLRQHFTVSMVTCQKTKVKVGLLPVVCFLLQPLWRLSVSFSTKRLLSYCLAQYYLLIIWHFKKWSLTFYINLTNKEWVIVELQNRVTYCDVTSRVTNSGSIFLL